MSQTFNNFFSLLLVLLLVGFALNIALIWQMAHMLLCPRRMTDAKAVYVLKRLSPLDLGLPFANLSFHLDDGIHLAGWWIPFESSKNCAILIHGYGDAKVGAIAWAPLFHRLGWNILAIDLRAHGESGGKFTTAGYYERHDLAQVIDQLKADRPHSTQRIALFGVSLGAAVAAATGVDRDDVEAVILESPYAEFESAVRQHARLDGMPGDFLVNLALKLAQWRSAAKFEQVAPVRLIPKIKGKVMVISAGGDPLVTPDQTSRLQRAIQERQDQAGANSICTWRVDEAFHVECLAARPDEYRDRLQQFLSPTPINDRPPVATQIAAE